MFINPINNSCTLNKIGFNSRRKPNIQRNHLKIMLSQDIWSPQLKVKMPETPLEKEVILEILKKRLKLDNFAKLSNERFNTIGNMILYREMASKNPKSEECISLQKELAPKGNLDTYLQELNKRLKQEKRNNSSEIVYFNNIYQMEEHYLERKLITEDKIDRFYSRIVKNNINKDGKYSTEELIKIIESGKIPTK